MVRDLLVSIRTEYLEEHFVKCALCHRHNPNCPRALYTNQQGANKRSSHIRRELAGREGKSQCPKPGDEKSNRLDKALAAQHQLTDVVAHQAQLGCNRQEP